MNRTQIPGSMTSRKSLTLNRGNSTSSDWKIYTMTWCYLQDRPTRRAHLKNNVLVLLKNPSGGFEDLVRIFSSELLKIRQSAAIFPVYRSLALAKTESKSKERTNLGSSIDGRCRETYRCNKTKACPCIFFPLYRNINSKNFC